MKAVVKKFIEENVNLINGNRWEEIHKILKETSEPIAHIDFVKSMLECGVNPGLPSSLENYNYESILEDLKIIETINEHDFTAIDNVDENVWVYLDDKDIGESLTNILRAIHYIEDDECILGNGKYSGNFRLCIPGVYEMDADLENLDIEVQVETDLDYFIPSLGMTYGPFQFNLKYWGDDWDKFNIKYNDAQYKNNINTALKNWVKTFITG